MENTATSINMDLLRELIGSRGRILRAKQRYTLEDAMAVFCALGQQLVPGFVVDNDNRFAYENLLRWLINDPAMQCESAEGITVAADPQKGIYLQGGTGTGKSLALDLARDVARYFHLSIMAEGTPRPLAWDNYRADDMCDIYSQEGDLRRWKEATVLCIQDLGSEPGEVLYMGNRRRVLGSIIEARGDMYDRLTLISSNLRITKAGELYGARVKSRLLEMCNILTLSGPDRRR